MDDGAPMIIVLGSVAVREGEVSRALALSQEHVTRSRAEPGCLTHAVHLDSENPLRLVFVEQWSDQAALDAHFKVPASRAFVKALSAMASAPPSIAIYQAAPLRP
jgi:quinol monooxygenase YgiN